MGMVIWVVGQQGMNGRFTPQLLQFLQVQYFKVQLVHSLDLDGAFLFVFRTMCLSLYRQVVVFIGFMVLNWGRQGLYFLWIVDLLIVLVDFDRSLTLAEEVLGSFVSETL
jgi:hypothetical protein